MEQRPKPDYESTSIPRVSQDRINQLSGTKQILDDQGPRGLLITSTGRRTHYRYHIQRCASVIISYRVRTKDMMNIASKTAEVFKDSFSLEMWVAQPLMWHIIS